MISLKEMCGIIGIYANSDVIKDVYQGLLAIQHRGQDSAGVITYDGRFHIKKGNGLVRDIFTAENIERLKGTIGVGHTRDPTVGGGRGEDAQPFLVNSPFGIIMAHNGNIINYAELKKILFDKYHRLLNSDNDVEVILNVFAQELAEQRTKVLKPQHVFKAAEGVFKKVKGGYSVVGYIAEEGMVAFRDPYGIKPLVYGKRHDGILPSYAIASESVSLNIMNFSKIENVQAGQVIFIDKNRTLHAKKITNCAHSPCLFEWVYFARPDSFIDNVNVYDCRVNLGSLLADEIMKLNLKIDVVVPVPDSARDAAIEIARKLNLKYREALVKNRYIGRTFIMPADQKRKSSVRQKLNTIASELKDKNVLLVDDSIVRGNTSRAIVELVRECGAKKVYFAAYSPP
jgi:amidophosphoribosyltransferase